MSGKFISTGMKTNNIQNLNEIEILMSLKIEELVIHVIPLLSSKNLSVIRDIGKFFSKFYSSFFYTYNSPCSYWTNFK